MLALDLNHADIDYLADKGRTPNYLALMLAIERPRYSTERALAKIGDLSQYGTNEGPGENKVYRTATNPNPARMNERQAQVAAFLYYRWKYQLAEIAKMYGCTDSTLLHTWKKHGLYKKGFRNKKRTGPCRVRAARFSPDEVQQIADMRAQGLLYRAIANHFDCGPTTIRRNYETWLQGH